MNCAAYINTNIFWMPYSCISLADLMPLMVFVLTALVLGWIFSNKDDLPLRIEQLLETQQEWVAGGTLERLEMMGDPGTAKPGTIGRTLQRMENDRIVAVRHVNGYDEYRFIPRQFRPKYVTLKERGLSSEMWRL